MGASKEEMQLVVKAVNEISAEMKAIRDEIHQTGSEAAGAGKQVEGLGSKLTSLAEQVKAGFFLDLGKKLFDGIVSGFEKLVSLIPQAVTAGNDWAKTIEQIQRETGMTAVQASTLAAVMGDAEVPTESMNRLFATLGRNLAQNEDLFTRLGIATRDSNGNFLSGYTIVDNLRRKFAEYGPSLIETAAAQKLLGRTGYEMLQFLQLNDAQFQLLAQHAADVGLVLSEDVVQGAHAFNIELRGLGDVFQGLQNNIFAGLLPTLTAFASGFADFLKQHMADIVAFVVNAANFVMGVIGGLLGIDFQAIKLSDVLAVLASGYADQAKQQKSMQQQLAGSKAGEDALTKAIKAQIEAIDEQIKKIDEREAKRHASEQKSKLQAAIDSAQANLTDIQGNAPYTAGLSAGEAELAIQKHNQDVIDAQKQLNDAIQAMRDFDADAADAAEKQKLEDQKTALQQQLQAHTAAHSAMGSNVTHLVGVNDTSWKAIERQVKSSFGTITASAQVWRDKGVAFAADLKGAIGGVIDAVLGSETAIYGPHEQVLRTTRSGGLLGALGAVGSAFGWIADHVGDVALGFRTLSTAIGLIGRVLTDALRVVDDIVSFNFGQAQADESALLGAIRSAAGSIAGHDMGGYIPAGFSSAVGEYARESVYAVPGGGIAVDTRAAGPSSGGDSHDITLYVDGYKLMKWFDQRSYSVRRNAPGTLRPNGAS